MELTTRSDGVYFTLKARPGARRSAIDGTHAGSLKVSVTAAPEKGKANEAIVELLSDRLHLSRSSISIMRGETSSLKTVRIVGTSEEKLRGMIEEILSRDTKQGNGR